MAFIPIYLPSVLPTYSPPDLPTYLSALPCQYCPKLRGLLVFICFFVVFGCFVVWCLWFSLFVRSFVLWLVPRCFLSYLPIFCPTYIFTSLPSYRPIRSPTHLSSHSPIYLPMCLPTYLLTGLLADPFPTHRNMCLITYQPTHLPIYLPTCSPTSEPTYLPTYIPPDLHTYLTYRPTYLPICRPTYPRLPT